MKKGWTYEAGNVPQDFGKTCLRQAVRAFSHSRTVAALQACFFYAVFAVGAFMALGRVTSC